jgi:hypothetical protein
MDSAKQNHWICADNGELTLLGIIEFQGFNRANAGRFARRTLGTRYNCLYYQCKAKSLHIKIPARNAKKACDKVVVSIFVNPSQFAPHEDLDKYPRTEEHDVALLEKEGADVVFAPKVLEIYPAGITTKVNEQRGTFVTVEGLSHQMYVFFVEDYGKIA